MKIVFVSNFFTHHQSELSKSFASMNEVSYHFIETQKMDDERKNMGWEISELPSYVINSQYFKDNCDVCQRIIDEADVVILGSAPPELVRTRLKNADLTFFYSERIYKNKYEAYKFPIRFIRFYRRYGQYKNAYMLCASAYAAADYAKTFTFLNKTYKWGYFPKVKQYADIDKLIELKQPSSILWVARLMEWKHPELPIMVAKRLKNEGYSFQLNLIGNGQLEGKIRQMISDNRLEDCVHMLGTMKPEQVREYMEQSGIFLFTSDRNEGWGAVLNESMNSACAVVASHAIGSVPFLMNDKKNGLIYKDGDFDDLYFKTKWLLDHKIEREQLGRNAYLTMMTEWNAENASERFIQLAKRLLSGEKKLKISNDGVCSQAKILKDDWYLYE